MDDKTFIFVERWAIRHVSVEHLVSLFILYSCLNVCFDSGCLGGCLFMALELVFYGLPKIVVLELRGEGGAKVC